MVPAKFFYDPDTLQQDTIGITMGSYPDLNKRIFKKGDVSPDPGCTVPDRFVLMLR